MTARENPLPYKRADDKAFYVRYDPTIPITAPEDRVENCLLKYKDQCENNQIWLTTIGIFISFLYALTSSTPHDVFFIHASTIEGITFVGTVLSGGATIYYYKKYYKKVDLYKIIACIKRQQE